MLVVLLWFRAVMVVPMMPVITTVPVPVPEFVTVPVLLIVFNVTPPVVTPAVFAPIALLFFRTMLLAPLIPPVTFRMELPLVLLLMNCSAAFGVIRPATFNCEVALFSMICVTFDPIAALMSVAPAPVPELVIVPVLFTAVVASVMPLFVAPLLFRIRFCVPVTPPLRVSTPVPAF